MTKRCTGTVILSVLIATLGLVGQVDAQALATPEGWRTSAERFVAMPPGFHITTSGSVLMYNPDADAKGEYTLTSNGFLFPGDSESTYGVFIGGNDLDTDDATWTSFEIGLDGNWVIRSRSLREDSYAVVADLAGPAAGPVAVPEGEGPTENLLQIESGADAVAFVLNGERVAELPSSEIVTEGVAGFRVGADLNLHLTTFSIMSGDVVRRFAPSPEEDQ
jgi:hypothetical protein